MHGIEHRKLLAIVRQLGLPTEELAGYIKVEGRNGRRIYIAKANWVTRVDISGFEVPGSGFVPFPGDNGNVTQQLDVSRPESEVLTNLRRALGYLVGRAEIRAEVLAGTTDCRKCRKKGAVSYEAVAGEADTDGECDECGALHAIRVDKLGRVLATLL